MGKIASYSTRSDVPREHITKLVLWLVLRSETFLAREIPPLQCLPSRECGTARTSKAFLPGICEYERFFQHALKAGERCHTCCCLLVRGLRNASPQQDKQSSGGRAVNRRYHSKT